MADENLNRKVSWFFEKRLSGTYDQDIPNHLLPESVKEGYQIQKALIKSIGSIIGAWKLGGSTAKTRQIFKTVSVYYGPIFEKLIFRAPTTVPVALLSSPKGEAEVAFRLSNFVDNLKSLPDDPWKLVDFVAPSIEFPTSTIKNISNFGLPALIADGCAYGALIIGKELAITSKLKKIINALTVSFYAGENKLSYGNSNTILTTPIGALCEFIEVSLRNDNSIEPGQWVATGGCTPCVSIPLNQKIEIDFSDLGKFAFYMR